MNLSSVHQLAAHSVVSSLSSNFSPLDVFSLYIYNLHIEYITHFTCSLHYPLYCTQLQAQAIAVRQNAVMEAAHEAALDYPGATLSEPRQEAYL